MGWCIIATWKFSLAGITAAAKLVGEGGSSLDAVEMVARYVEDDPSVESVGYGAIPNVDGEIELDAAIMEGDTLSIGAVMCVKGYRNPVSIARRVLEDTPHNILVGRGAEDFAARKGFEKTMLLNCQSIEKWLEKKAEAGERLKKGLDYKVPMGHDTVGIVSLDTLGKMASATSTSGTGMKLGGRVGDSPLVGSGFYVDSYVGGAAATGVGEDIMRCCTCFYAVELMREGYSPGEAAELAVKKTHKRLLEKRGRVGNIAIVCADNKGNFGGACNHQGFEYAAASHNCPPRVYMVTPIDG